MSSLMRGAGKAPGGASLPVIALYQSLLEEKDARLVEKDSRLVAMLAEKDARLVEKDAHLVGMLAEKDARLVAMDALLLEKAKLEAANARELAVALHDADVARGIVGSRALFEACLVSLWQQAHAEVREQPPDSSMGERARKLLRAPSDGGKFPGLLSALTVAAEDNGVPAAEVILQARRMYETLSSRVHAEELGGTAALPADVFAGRPALIAFATIVRAAGRELSLYGLGRKKVPLRLRMRVGSAASLEQARAVPMQPEVLF